MNNSLYIEVEYQKASDCASENKFNSKILLVRQDTIHMLLVWIKFNCAVFYT